MPLKRKAVWYCCPRDEATTGYKPLVEVSVEVENGTTATVEAWCFGFKLTSTETPKLKFCPSCGTPIPDSVAIATLEGLTDNEG